MAWFECIKGNGGGGGDATIIKGETMPAAGQGSNGQLYLQYVDNGSDTFGTPDSNTPTGATISSNSQYMTYAPYKAFGGNADGWGANGSTGTLVFAFDTDTFVPKILSFVDYFDVSGGYLKANSFTFEGSNDGSNWDILYTKSDSADVKDLVKTVDISTQMAYSQFRFVVNGGAGYAGIKNVVLWSESDESPIINTYAKVSGAWQDLIGTDVNDIGGASPSEPVMETASVFRWFFGGGSTCWGIMKKTDSSVIGQNGDDANASITLDGDIMQVVFHGSSQSIEVTAKTDITLRAYSTGRTMGTVTPTEYQMSANDIQTFTPDNLYGGLYLEAIQ